MTVEKEQLQAPAVTGTRTVAPAKRKVTLATFDLPYITFYYNQNLLLYRLAPGDAAFHDVVAPWPPLSPTGRIRQGEDGAEVVEAVAVDDLAGEEADRVMQHLVPYTGVMNLEGLHRPLLAVQLFPELILSRRGNGMHACMQSKHAVLDGTSTWHLMSSWAELPLAPPRPQPRHGALRPRPPLPATLRRGPREGRPQRPQEAARRPRQGRRQLRPRLPPRPARPLRLLRQPHPLIWTH